MNLVIDIGNSNIKLAIFEGKKILFKEAIKHIFFLRSLKSIDFKFQNIKNVIVSCVGHLGKNEEDFMRVTWNYYEITNNLKFTFNNLYEKDSLGVDRIALIEACKEMFERKNILAIDMGSCNTYNLITEKGDFVGGVISNGLSMRYSAINKFTARLPKVEMNVKDINIKSLSTNSSINSGILQGFIYELKGFISSYSENYSNLRVIITGGNAFIVANEIKNIIFVNNFFILRGINIIFNNNFGELRN